jgi:hypothetical protein
MGMNEQDLLALNETLVKDCVASLPLFQWKRSNNFLVGILGKRTIAIDEANKSAVGSLLDETTLTLIKFDVEQSKTCLAAAQDSAGEAVVSA